MKKYIFFSFILPATLSSLLFSQHMPGTTKKIYSIGDNVNLRNKPSLHSKKVSLLKKHERVTLLQASETKTKITLHKKEYNRAWLQVKKIDGTQGWAHALFFSEYVFTPAENTTFQILGFSKDNKCAYLTVPPSYACGFAQRDLYIADLTTSPKKMQVYYAGSGCSPDPWEYAKYEFHAVLNQYSIIPPPKASLQQNNILFETNYPSNNYTAHTTLPDTIYLKLYDTSSSKKKLLFKETISKKMSLNNVNGLGYLKNPYSAWHVYVIYFEGDDAMYRIIPFKR